MVFSDPLRDRGGIRCSDAERNEVSDILTRAHIEGKLSFGECNQRVEQVVKAKTRRDLVIIVEDLLDAENVGFNPNNYIPSPEQILGVERMSVIMATEKRQGYWKLREQTLMNLVLAKAILDFSKADFQTLECVIRVSMYWSTLELYVPENICVIDSTMKPISKVKNIGYLSQKYPKVKIMITGRIICSNIKIYGSKSRKMRRMLKSS